MTATDNPTRRESLNIRIQADDRSLIDQAARLLGKTRTDFVLDAARQAATDALLDRTLFQVDETAYAAFVARLDAPPEPNERLMRSLGQRPIWDKQA